MTLEEAEEYTASLEQHDEAHWRQVALGVKIGIPKDLGLSRSEWCRRVINGSIRGAERLDAILELKGDGLSNRAIADVLGVDEGTIRGDITGEDESAENSAEEEGIVEGEEDESAENSAEEDEVSEEDGRHDMDGCDVPDPTESEDTRWNYNFECMANYSIELVAHWNKNFSGWRNIQPTKEEISLAKKAAETWRFIAKTLEEKYHG